MVSHSRARRNTKRRIEENALRALHGGIMELDITPESLFKRFNEKNKHTFKTSKKAQQDLGKSIFGIVKDFVKDYFKF